MSKLFVSHVNDSPSFIRKCMKSWLAQGSSGRRVTLPTGTTFLHVNGASDKIPALTDWNPGTLKFFVCSLNILNKSDKQFLPFHDSFHGLEAHIHLDFHLEKYIYIIAFTPGKIKEFYDEQLEEPSEMTQFFLDLFKAFLCLTF